MIRLVAFAAALAFTSTTAYAAKGGKPKDFVFSDTGVRSEATFDSGPNPDGSAYALTMGTLAIDGLTFDTIQKLKQWNNLQSQELHVNCPAGTVSWIPVEASKAYLSPEGAIRVETEAPYSDPNGAIIGPLSDPNNPKTSLFCLVPAEGGGVDSYLVLIARYVGTGAFRCVDEVAETVILLRLADQVGTAIGPAGVPILSEGGSRLAGVTVPASCP